MKTQFIVNPELAQITMVRSFNCPVGRLWRCWTEPSLLDQWWAPRPYQNHTVHHELASGGRWQYYMQAPDGARHYCFADYALVMPISTLSWQDGFCDAQGMQDTAMPSTAWHTDFIDLTEGTSQTRSVLQYKDIEAMNTVIMMGFQQGLNMAFDNLDEVVSGI